MFELQHTAGGAALMQINAPFRIRLISSDLLLEGDQAT
jgi:hypothetical protein